MKRIVLTVCLTLLQSSIAGAAGYHTNQQSPLATGRNFAVVASDTTGSSIYFNVGGLGFTKGLTFQVGANAIAPIGTFTDTGGLAGPAGTETKTETGLAFLPNFYMTYAFNELLHVGLGVSLPFGLRVKWPANSPGRELTLEQSMTTVYFTPAIALNLSEWASGLSLGAGLDLIPGSVSVKRSIELGAVDGSTELKGTAFAVGGRFGLMYHPDWAKSLKVGVSYRTQATMKFEGNADIDGPATLRGALPPDGPARIDIPLPMSVQGGVAYSPLENLEFEVNAYWFGWDEYKTQEVHIPSLTASETILATQRNWRNTLTVRAGVEYDFTTAGLDLRAGYAYDPTPVPTSTLDFGLVDYDRHMVSVGLSYAVLHNLFVDGGFMVSLPGKVTATGAADPANTPGDYNLHAFIGSLGIRWNIDT